MTAVTRVSIRFLPSSASFRECKEKVPPPFHSLSGITGIRRYR